MELGPCPPFATLLRRYRQDAGLSQEELAEMIGSSRPMVSKLLTEMTERGQTRGDDRVTEAAMEDRKRQGYF